MSAKLADNLRKVINNEITGPYTPTIEKVADNYLRKIRISFKKDRFLKENKVRLKESINLFEKSSSYDGHISTDVDPL